jgi:exonuclease 3'-5' domain-containing protein 2
VSTLVVDTRSVTKATRPRPKDPRVAVAESWLADYRACKPQVRAAPSAIRAYRLWHSNLDLQPQDVAKLLRDPPLQTNTIVSYILETLRLEKLPFDKARLRDEVLELVPKEVRALRYKALVDLVEVSKPAIPRYGSAAASGGPATT